MKNKKLDQIQKKRLLQIARESIEAFVSTGQIKDFEISDDRLKAHEGAFVTIFNNNHELRGCIGIVMNKTEALWQVVRDMAIAACSEDDRFLPISEIELAELKYEISVLSEPKEIKDWRKIELGRHGVIIEKGMRSGVFLPQVAIETAWSLEEFLSNLCSQKAGLPSNCYKNDPETKLSIFTADVFSEDSL